MAKILIVDDEPRIRELIRENLQYSGYTCEEAGDGSAAPSVRLPPLPAGKPSWKHRPPSSGKP